MKIFHKIINLLCALGIVLGGIAAVVVTILASVFINGFVVMHLWQWFVVPLGFQAINYVHAAGIMLLATFLTVNPTPTKKSRKEIVIDLIAHLITQPALVLLLGYFLSRII